MNNKKSIELNAATTGNALKLFFIRRFLRIFPIYYLTLAILLYYNMGYVRNYAIYYLTYTVNFYNFFNQNWLPYGHLWSLCVEEQFYLIWPFVILCTPKKWLLHVIIIFTLIGPAFRCIAFANNPFYFAFPLSSFDGFGMGALLAYSYVVLQREGKHINKKLFKRLGFAGFLFFLLKPLTESVPSLKNFYFLDVLYFSSVMCMGCYLVQKFSEGFEGYLKYIFESRILIYIGKISYSLYIFHFMMPDAFKYLRLSGILPFEGYYKVCYFIILIALSSASWYFFEKPILLLKKKFEYKNIPATVKI